MREGKTLVGADLTPVSAYRIDRGEPTVSELASDMDRYASVQMVSPDAMRAAASYLEREYGYSGYSIGLESGGYGGGIFRVRCSDGGEFHLVADRWGNVTDVREGETIGDAVARLTDSVSR